MWGQKKEIRLISRRDGLKILSALGIIAVTPKVLVASPTDVSSLIGEITKGKHAEVSDIYLDLPEIAENGNTVPIGVESKKAAAIKILALGNPGPDVITFKFGPLSATRSASTRIRLRKTQEVLRAIIKSRLKNYLL